MAEYIIQSKTLTEIADAIRSKTGSADAIGVSEMAQKIIWIGTGFDDKDENLEKFAYQLDSNGKSTLIYYVVYENVFDTAEKTSLDIPVSLGGYDVVLACT